MYTAILRRVLSTYTIILRRVNRMKIFIFVYIRRLGSLVAQGIEGLDRSCFGTRNRNDNRNDNRNGVGGRGVYCSCLGTPNRNSVGGYCTCFSTPNRNGVGGYCTCFSIQNRYDSEGRIRSEFVKVGRNFIKCILWYIIINAGVVQFFHSTQILIYP